eukprot:Colp12_sorted_trinity150504_noHs@27802
MIKMRSSALLVAVAICVLAASAQAACPTVKPVDNLDLKEYIRATWYIHQQQLNGYQRENELYCVTATYALEGKKVPFFKGTVVSVFNSANVDEVNGFAEGAANGTILCARVPDEKTPASLLVAPCFLPNILAGPYLVIAVGGATNGQYDWAVVSGGQPTVEFADGCTTPEAGVNGAGLWIFSRKPVMPAEDLLAARTALKNLGYTLTRLRNVPQGEAGCTYKDFPGLKY